MLVRSLLLALLLIAIAGVDLCAQSQEFKVPEPILLERGLQGRILVKLDRAAFYDRKLSPAIFGDEAKRYGIYNVEPWLNPALVAFNHPPVMLKGSGESRVMALRRIMVIEYSSLDAPEQVAVALGMMRGVEYAEPIYQRELLYTPNDPAIPQQWYLDRIEAKKAWDQIRGDSSIIVAITDSGIERAHPELSSAIWNNPGESGAGKELNGIDDDSNGFIDDWWGWDFGGTTGKDEDNSPLDVGAPHGTQVAGVVAAAGDNAEGIAGVAYGVRVMAVKIRAESTSKLVNEPEAVLYAAKMGADVINCSWGSEGGKSLAEEEIFNVVINDYGCIVVAAEYKNGTEKLTYPASYPGVFAVAATTQQDSKASFSNFNYHVDISAPGESIYSTKQGGYGYDDGTSFSTPMVSASAALVKLRFPAFTNEQVMEVLKATSDNIDANLQSNQLGKMGAGRLNVGTAVSEGGTVRSARMVDYRLVEGNPDGIVEPGERIRIEATVKNILADAPSVTAELFAISGTGIEGFQIKLGAMSTGETRKTLDTVFNFTIPSTTEPNTELVFRVAVSTPDRINENFVVIRVAPNYQTTDLNQIASTFNSSGNIAFNGLNRTQGDGFTYQASKNLIFHGGVMMGVSPERIADVVRVAGLNDGTADGFRPSQLYRLRLAPDSSVETGTARFNDNHLAPPRQVGLDVAMTTYEYRDARAENFVIVSYQIKNTSGARLDSLHCGLFLDWDVSTNGVDDRVDYDESNRMGFTRDTRDTASLYAGAVLLTPQQINFYAVNNDLEVSGNFPAAKKWDMLSGGIHEYPGTTDMAMVISGGGVALAPNESVEVAFALMVAPSFDSLRASAGHARSFFQPSSAPSPETGNALTLSAAPNPTTGGVSFNVTIPATSHGKLAIYNLQGEAVATLFDGRLDAGERSFFWNAADLPDGIYIYELRSGGSARRGKLVKMASGRR